jgi:DNA helicase-2/ATP-dependent DNA helicase PcrA
MSRTEVKYLLSLIRVGYELNKDVMDETDFIKQVAILSDELAADIGEESFNLVCKLNNGMNLLEKIKNIDTLNIAGIGPKRKAGFVKFYEKLSRVKQEYARIEKDGISTFLNYCVDEILEFKFAKKATKMVYDLIEDTLRDINSLILDIEGETLIDRVGTFVVEFSGEESSEVKDKVIGMTVHKAKGTENKVVFIIDFTDFPATFSSDEEEEKRILYVAVTRAKEKLYLTSSGYRFIYLDLIRSFKYLETNVPMDTINTEDFYKKTERYDLWK